MGPKRSSWKKLAGHRRLAVMLAATIGLWAVEFGLAGHVAEAADPDAAGTRLPPRTRRSNAVWRSWPRASTTTVPTARGRTAGTWP